MFNKNFNENCNCEYDCEFHGNCKACLDNHVKDAKRKICYTKLRIEENKKIANQKLLLGEEQSRTNPALLDGEDPEPEPKKRGLFSRLFSR